VKILILGVAAPQMDAIHWLRNQGYEIHAASNRPCSQCNEIDVFTLTDITDIAAINAYFRANAIDTLYSVGSDVAMPTTAAVLEINGKKPLVDSQQTAITNNKGRFRSFLQEKGEKTLLFRKVGSLAECIDWAYFPAVIKPVDSQGQRGVKRVASVAELNEQFADTISHSKSGEVIIEEYIDGQEFSANLFILDGQIIQSFISDRITHGKNGFGLVKAHVLPSALDRKQVETANTYFQHIISLVGIQNGPAYIQFKMQHGNRPVIIEMAARLDGCHIWRLIKTAYGVDLLEQTLRMVVGETVAPKKVFSKSIPSHTLEFYSYPSASVFKKDSLPGKDKVIYNEYYYDDGDIVRSVTGHLEKAGYFIWKN
jgi:biotin carboxylase